MATKRQTKSEAGRFYSCFYYEDKAVFGVFFKGKFEEADIVMFRGPEAEKRADAFARVLNKTLKAAR